MLPGSAHFWIRVPADLPVTDGWLPVTDNLLTILALVRSVAAMGMESPETAEKLMTPAATGRTGPAAAGVALRSRRTADRSLPAVKLRGQQRR